MAYDHGCHTVFYHRYHIVWATKYRYDVLRGELRLRVREIIRPLPVTRVRKGPRFVGPYQSIAWFYAASTGQISIRGGFKGHYGHKGGKGGKAARSTTAPPPTIRPAEK